MKKILLSMEHMHRHLIDFDYQLKHIKKHLAIPPATSCSADNNKELIQVMAIDSNPPS